MPAWPSPTSSRSSCDSGAPVGLRLPADPQAVLDVLRRGHVREEAVRLEDHPHVALVRGHARQVAAVDDDPPRVGPVEAGHEAQRRRLAAAARAEERYELALLEREVDALQRDDRPEGAVQALELEVRHPPYLPTPTRTVRCPPRRPMRSSESIAAHVMAKLMSVTAAAG